MMDVAVPANLHIGFAQSEVARRRWAVMAAEALSLIGRCDVAFIDLREAQERDKHGEIPEGGLDTWRKASGPIVAIPMRCAD